MVASIAKYCAVALAALTPVLAKNSFSHGGGVVKHKGEPKGFFKEISGSKCFYFHLRRIQRQNRKIGQGRE